MLPFRSITEESLLFAPLYSIFTSARQQGKFYIRGGQGLNEITAWARKVSHFREARINNALDQFEIFTMSWKIFDCKLLKEIEKFSEDCTWQWSL